uniref:F-box associated domain-containing protein n=1 Tax=Leersia perrieri TaxID=77586 RepID=A0A0D9WDB8_9ORYZ
MAVDVEGETWWTMNVPEFEEVEEMWRWMPGFIGHSQRKLYYISDEYNPVPSNMSVWVLEDYYKDEWTVTTEQLCEKINYKYKIDLYNADCYELTIHPDFNLIYYVAGVDCTLMAYDMDPKESRVIRNLGSDYKLEYLPYVPLYSEILSNGD